MSRPFPVVPGVTHALHDVATGIRMHVAEAGPASGPPVLLLHGWPQHWWCWREVIGPLAAAGHRVLAADLRGAGWSDAPADGYEKEQLADDILALLDARGIDHVAVVGHDWGGWVAQLITLRAPERVERAVLCNIAPVWPPKRRRRAAAGAWRLAYQPFVGAPWLGPVLQRSGLMRGVLRGVPEADQAEFRAALAEPGHAEAAAAYYRTFLLRELRSIAAGRYEGQRLTRPVLVLHGTADPVIRPAAVAEFADHADELELVRLDGAGHFVVDERPDEVTRRIAAFLAAGGRAPTA